MSSVYTFKNTFDKNTRSNTQFTIFGCLDQCSLINAVCSNKTTRLERSFVAKRLDLAKQGPILTSCIEHL